MLDKLRYQIYSGPSVAGFMSATNHTAIIIEALQTTITGISCGWSFNTGTTGLVRIFPVDSLTYTWSGSPLISQQFNPGSLNRTTIQLTDPCTGLTIGNPYALVFNYLAGYGVSIYSMGISNDTTSFYSTNGSSWIFQNNYLQIAVGYASGGFLTPYPTVGGNAHGYSGGIGLYNDATRVARGGIKTIFEQDTYVYGCYHGIGTRSAPSTAYYIKAEICNSSSVLASSINSTSNTPIGWLRFEPPYLCLANTTYYICLTPVLSSVGAAGFAYYISAFEQKVPTSITKGIFREYVTSTATALSWTESSTLYANFYLDVKPASGGLTGGISRGRTI